MRTRDDIIKGMKVRGSDGKDLGKVVAFGDDTFMIEKGFFFPKDYYCRYDEIADIRDGDIWLTQSSADLKAALGHERGLEEKPAGTRLNEEYRVPLAEEELTAEKRLRQAGEVKVHKEVTTEQKQVSVPVTKEQVIVERVPVSGEAHAGEAEFKETSVSIPVTEEEVEIRKRPVIREEVRVSKTGRQEERG